MLKTCIINALNTVTFHGISWYTGCLECGQVIVVFTKALLIWISISKQQLEVYAVCFMNKFQCIWILRLHDTWLCLTMNGWMSSLVILLCFCSAKVRWWLSLTYSKFTYLSVQRGCSAFHFSCHLCFVMVLSIELQCGASFDIMIDGFIPRQCFCC